MAEIFKAKTQGAHGFEKTLVIKRILPHLAQDSEFIDMFIDEAKLMVQLNHPKIVQVLDFGELEGQYYMALEHVDGIDGLAMLRRCAKRRCRPTTGIVLHIIADVLDALEYAHRLTLGGRGLGIVHRDISPSNIFISWQGEVKLGDFGIARAAIRRGHTEGGALKGKYGYMAPEQVTGQTVDHRADIFAVGVVLAELLMIRRLFYAKADLEVLLLVRDAKLTRLDKYGNRIPIDLRSILDSALARDPNLRYQDAGTFRDALHRYLFENRRMVRSTDVRNFLSRLMETEEPITRKSESLERSVRQASLLANSAIDGNAVESPIDDVTPAIPREIDLQRLHGPLGAEPPVPLVARKRGDAAMPSPPAFNPTPRAIADAIIAEDTPATETYRRDAIGKKRKIMLTPPPAPPPVPTGLPHTGEEPRIATQDALAAVPEMAASGSVSQSDFLSYQSDEYPLPDPADLKEPIDAEMVVAERLTNLGGRRSAKPDFAGELADCSMFTLLFGLAVSEETGLLVVEFDSAIKEIYLVDGDPTYVTSNQADELFGQYLVSKGVLSKGELSMALAMLPHFNGKLGDTLVALKLLRPVQVLRHLTHQVRQKLLDAFAWAGGKYRFYLNRECKYESAPLGLDAFEIIGAAVQGQPRDRMGARLATFMDVALHAVSPAPVPPEVFRLGTLPRRVYDRLDGRHTLRQLFETYTDPVQRDEFAQIVFLLLETGLAAAG